MEGFNFIPPNVTIGMGTTVLWTNYDGATHTTTSDTGVWDSGPLTGGQSFDYTFYVPGDYPYHCTIHPGMTGTITVQTACTPTPTLTPSCPLRWRTVSSPNNGTNSNYLLGVASVSANDVWAVGYYFNGIVSVTLIEHWDGTQWSVIPSPNASNGRGVLTDVAVVSANDVWAVGNAATQPLIEHWNGTQWSVVSSPDIGTGMIGLNAVGVVAPNDIWAVGHYDDSGTSKTLVQHWNGAFWSIVSSPNVGTSNNFLWGGVAGASADDLWAVGSYGTSGNEQTLTLHWDGTQWSVVPSPNVGAATNRLTAVDATSENDVWAVGFYGPNSVESTLIEHWNGTQWSVTPSQNPGLSGNQLYGVTANPANAVWAVGFHSGGTLVEHWDGADWVYDLSPNPPGSNYLVAASGTSYSDVWAVGYTNVSNVPRTLVLHYSYQGAGCPTSTPTFTPTPTRTSTPTPVCPVTNRMVIITSFQFTPPNVTALVGATVGWLNEGPITHTTTSDTGVWDSGVLSPGNTFQFTFNSPGTYPYHCTIHPTMTGIITVLAGCTPTATSTGTATSTPTETPTGTSTPSLVLVGHVTWQSRPAQPNPRQAIAITLTLRLQSGGPASDYMGMYTDASGFFTVPVGGLPSGNYNWRVKDPKYLASSGALTLTGAPTTNVEMGLMRAGDCNDSNVVNATDFTILKGSFGSGIGDPDYDDRADLTGDRVVNAGDFAALKNNFGTSGAPPIHP